MQISLPFRFSGGVVAAERDPDVEVAQNIVALVGTNPTERVMLNDFGVAFQPFESQAEAEQEVLVRLQQMVARWLPAITAIDVSLLPQDPFNPAALTFSVNYTVRAVGVVSTTAPVRTAIINIDGRILELSNG